MLPWYPLVSLVQMGVVLIVAVNGCLSSSEPTEAYTEQTMEIVNPLYYQRQGHREWK